jgi:hypothetical protein
MTIHIDEYIVGYRNIIIITISYLHSTNNRSTLFCANILPSPNFSTFVFTRRPRRLSSWENHHPAFMAYRHFVYRPLWTAQRFISHSGHSNFAPKSSRPWRRFFLREIVQLRFFVGLLVACWRAERLITWRERGRGWIRFAGWRERKKGKTQHS